MTPPIGIDLGTTNSVVAYVEGGRSETIPNSEGQKTTPSVVLLRDEELIVGELAKRQLIAQPLLTVRSVKRLMGQRYSEVKSRVADFPYEVVEGPDDKAVIRLGQFTVTPEEISAAILAKMRRTAEDFISQEVDQAVITVPAHFNDSQRTATKKAAEMAGLEVLRIINEPTAAALAYGIDRCEEEKIAVFDFGGGTFDISILQLAKGIFEVLATNGNTQLGGDNLDLVLTRWIVEAIRKETGCDPESEIQSMQRIRETSEKVKCELSSLTSTSISLPFIVADASGPKHFNREITREEFVSLSMPVLRELVLPCKQVMRDAGLKPESIDRVLLVGGSTRIPEVRRIVRDLFQKEPSHSVNPDEAVAIGAAIQSGIMTGSLQEVLLLDVVPLSLGIELAGGVFKPLIPRNSTIPTTVTRKFTTVVDNQQAVVVHVLQGERKMAKENRTLARFRLAGIAPAPREVPEVEVRFNIDANGILQVSAQDLTSGKAESVVVESFASAIPSTEEVERVVREAQEHSVEDQAFIAHAQQVERMQRLQNQMEKFLKTFENVTEEDFKAIKEAMIRLDIAARAREWGETDSVELEFKMIRGKYGSDEQLAKAMAKHFGFPGIGLPLKEGGAEGEARPEPVVDTESVVLDLTPGGPESAGTSGAAADKTGGTEAAKSGPAGASEPKEESLTAAPEVPTGAKKFKPPSWLFPGSGKSGKPPVK